MADNPINLATLQQQDPYISEIMGMATQVQLYNYNKAIKNEWVSKTYYFVCFRGIDWPKRHSSLTHRVAATVGNGTERTIMCAEAGRCNAACEQ